MNDPTTDDAPMDQYRDSMSQWIKAQLTNVKNGQAVQSTHVENLILSQAVESAWLGFYAAAAIPSPLLKSTMPSIYSLGSASAGALITLRTSIGTTWSGLSGLDVVPRRRPDQRAPHTRARCPPQNALRSLGLIEDQRPHPDRRHPPQSRNHLRSVGTTVPDRRTSMARKSNAAHFVLLTRRSDAGRCQPGIRRHWSRMTPVVVCAVVGLCGILAPGSANAQPQTQAQGAEYVALGDSYVAVGSISGTVGTLVETKGSCQQSSDNVNALVAARLHTASFADWSCGGATTGNIVGDRESLRGAIGNGRPQVAGLSERTRFVNLSIGGNDNGFYSNSVDCLFRPNSCGTAERNAMSKAIDELPVRLDTAYDAVRRHAPNAKVVVAAYERFLPNSAHNCPVAWANGPQRVHFVNSQWKQFTETIEITARKHGLSVVGAWDDNAADHSVCAKSGSRYWSITGLEASDSGIPMHLTSLGRRHVANEIAETFIR